ncbi:MAG TPA: glycosyltransferase [Bacteroidales bacterium]|jgi:Glycosyltransferase
MRILWLSGNPALFTKDQVGYYGGGWIGALENSLTQMSDVELGIAFFWNDDQFKIQKNKTTYYPIGIYNTNYKKIKRHLLYKRHDVIEMEAYKRIIDDFKPDLIHVWGTEMNFGMISKYTNIPVVVHIQGILNPYLNAYFIPGCSKRYFILHWGKGILRKFFTWWNYHIFKLNARRELDILKNSKYFIGRTDWDKSILSLFNPTAQYFYCSEVLRDPFYKAEPWVKKYKTKFSIVSTISKSSFKGFDLVLKTANILRKYGNINFEWNIYGVNDFFFMEKFTGLDSRRLGINFKGIVTADALTNGLLNSDVYVNTSYIDNSPNSVCEAQFLGLPVISTNVGGISSLIENNVNGILVPANDPYYLASQIQRILVDTNESIRLGTKGREIAQNRHNQDVIGKDLKKIYYEVLY